MQLMTECGRGSYGSEALRFLIQQLSWSWGSLSDFKAKALCERRRGQR